MPEHAYRLLGGLEVSSPTGLLDVGPRKQQALLGVLLLQSGRTLSLDGLVGAIWGADAPERAEASVHSYISTLRRALEPDRRPREPATVLVTRGQGYALVADRDQVDAWRFEDLVSAARTCSAAGELDRAGQLVGQALADYAPLLPEFEHDEWSRPDRIRLERVHAAAVRLSYDVRLARGEHRALEPELRAAVDRDPLDEEVAALLATALYRSDRQREALQVLADCKRALGDQLGVDPGPRLRQLEVDLLSQADHLAVVPPQRVAPAGTSVAPVGKGDDPAPAQHHLVGRAAELDALLSLTARTRDGVAGVAGVAVVEGEAGAGKTALLDALAASVAGQVDVVWGRCAQGPGTPVMWPWSQVVGALAPGLPDEAYAALSDGPLSGLLDADGQSDAPDPGAGFRQGEALLGLLASRVATGRPLLVVLDDAHWADEASTVLVEQLCARLPAGVTLVVALREQGQHAPEHLARMLAALARLPSQQRLHLHALDELEVAAVLEQELGRPATPQTAAVVHERSGGNPFYVRELARLVRADVADQARTAAVPATVRDVVRSRLATLPDSTAELLRLAAVQGRDVDLTVLAAATGTSAGAAFEGLAPAVEDGVLVPHPAGAGRWRFSHDLVRDAVVGTIAPMSLPRLHLRIADALDAGADRTPHDAEAMAHHLWSAGPLADPARTAGALLLAARSALGKHAYAAASRHLELVIGVARAAGLDGLELDGIALMTVVVSVQGGYVSTDDDLLARGEELAARLGRQRLAAELLYARWGAASQRIQLDRSAELIARLSDLAASSDDPVVQLYAVHGRGIDEWDRGQIDAAAQALDRAAELLAELDSHVGSPDALAYDVRLLSPAFRALVRTLGDDVDEARVILAGMRRRAEGDPYRIVVWAHFSANCASIAADPAWCREACEQGLAADPENAFAFLGSMLRSEHAWAVGRSGSAQDAEVALAQALELDRLMEEMGALSGQHGSLIMNADLQLAAGDPVAAARTLDAAQESVERWGQRTNEPMIGVLRAKAQLATGEPADVVRATLEASRALAVERGSLIFARQADEVLAQLVASGGTASGAAEA